MDPATGASTWAFGSHKWVRNIGIFTRNAAIIAIHHSVWVAKEKEGGTIGSVIDRCPLLLDRIIKVSSRGSEAEMV